MLEYLSAHWLDITTTILGIIYLVLEYKASIALWIVGIIMPALDVWLYWTHGLYGDAGMAVYYTLAALYGYAVWKFGRKHGQKQSGDMPITRMPRRLYLPATVAFFVIWVVVDIVCCYLYVVKGIPFKAGLYGLYVVVAVLGYRKWKSMMQ